MKAVTFKGKKEMAVDEVKEPQVSDPRDAIVKVTSAAICGSDLHMYDGRTEIEEGTIFGHEIMGVIDDVGEAVTTLKKGDRVVLPFNIGCGFCMNCVRGITSACLTANPDKAGAAYGYAEMGPFEGGQTEFVRVPFAEFNCLKLPGKPGDKFENDFLMLADIFPTGYHATEMAQVQPGSTVAIYGAGPVGLLAAYSAILRGAAEVYVVDRSESRLKIAEKIGATPINFNDGLPSEQIKKIRKNNPLIVDSHRPGEFEKMPGVMCGIDAVGYQALGFDDNEEDPKAVLEDLAEIVNPTGHIGVIGVFVPSDKEGKDGDAKDGKPEIPFGKIWNKGISLGTGQTPVKKYDAHLRNLIISGKANPGIIVSHEISLDEAPDAYEKFDFRGVGEGAEYTKVIIKP